MSLAVRRGLIVMVAVLIAEAAWILAVPPFRGVDEFAHTYRAAGVATGQWHLQDVAPHGRGQLVWVPDDLVRAASAQCKALPYTEHDDCTPVATHDGQARIATSAGSYNPLFYWVLGTIAKPFHGDTALYVMRSVLALVCALLLGLGAGVLSLAGARQWTMLALVTAITPQVVFSCSIVSPNGLEMALGFVLWGSLLTFERASPANRERRLLAIAFGAAFVLTFLRQIGPLWDLTIVASVAIVLGWGKCWELLRRRWATVAVGMVAVVVGLAWNLVWTQIAARLTVPPNATGVDIPEQWAQAFYLHRWMLQMVGAFPFRDVPAPLWVYPLAFVVIGFLTWVAIRRDRRRSRAWGLVALLVVYAAIPIALSVHEMPTSGAIWQGRYELPLVIGFLPVCGLILDEIDYAPQERTKLIVGSALALVLVNVACVIHVQQLELARKVSVTDPGWVHLPTWLLALLMLAACAATSLLFRTGRWSSDDPEPATAHRDVAGAH